MTEEELKSLPADTAETVIEVAEPPPVPEPPSAADEAAEKLQQQVARAQEAMRAAQATAEAERQARWAAEQRVAQTQYEARGQVQTAELQSLHSSIENLARLRDSAKIELKRAYDSGEGDKIADAQQTIAETTSQIVNLEQAKNYYAANGPRPTEGRVQPQQQYVDPVEVFIGAAAPPVQTWLRQHRDMVVKDANGTPKLDPRLLKAHHAALAEDLTEQSPEYFQFIEGRLNPQQQPMADNQTTNQATPRKQASVAAPVSRDVGTSNGKQPTMRIQLTKDEVGAAHMFGDPKKTEREREIEYWQNKQALEKEGRLGARN